MTALTGLLTIDDNNVFSNDFSVQLNERFNSHAFILESFTLSRIRIVLDNLSTYVFSLTHVLMINYPAFKS